MAPNAKRLAHHALRTSILGIALMACSPPGPSPPTRPLASAPVASVMPPSSESTARSDPTAPFAPTAPTEPTETPLEAPLATPFDLRAWLDERGFPPGQQPLPMYGEPGCDPVGIHDGPHAVRCRVSDVVGGQKAERVQLREVIFTVRKGRVALLLDAIVAITQLDKEDPTHADVVNFELDFSADMSRVTIRDSSLDVVAGRTMQRCDATLSALRSRARAADASAYDHLDLKLVTAACKQRGDYRFDGRRYVVVAKTRAPGTPTSGPPTSGP